MTDWYVLRSATRQWKRAMASLTELGLAHYVPMETRWRRTARIKERIETPLFGDYLFAKLEDADFWKASEADGVHAILRTKGEYPRPIPVPAMLVEAIRQSEADGLFDKTATRLRKDPEKGASINIIGGQFQGFPAQFVERRKDERIQVLFQMFGRWSPLTLKADQVHEFAEEDAA